MGTKHYKNEFSDIQSNNGQENEQGNTIVSGVKINKQFKDRLFRLRFGSEECRKDMF